MISFPTLTVLAAAAQYVHGAPVEAALSPPFKLQAHSKNPSISGKDFGTCHIGAALESLCLYSDDTAAFHLNTTHSQPALPRGVSKTGDLVWILPSVPDEYPQDMSFYSDNEFGLYYAIFGLGEIQPVAFSDKTGALGVVKNTSAGKPELLQKWYVCDFSFEGYTYPTLAWTTADSPPASRNCSSVSVIKN